MGYELTYHFREEVSKGEYSEEVKTKTVKIGTPEDDMPLDAAAGKIMSMLARRNILLEDVEVYEFTKKKLSFKMAEDGILIKNRKFKFDDGPISVGEVPMQGAPGVPGPVAIPDGPGPQGPDANALLAMLLANPQFAALLNPQQQQTNGNGNGNGNNLPKPKVAPGGNLAAVMKPDAPIRHEIYNPVDPNLGREAKRRGFAFTLGKKYPIFKERSAGNPLLGMLYTTMDDNGNKQVLNDKHFTPEIGVLENGFVEEFKPISGGGDPRLEWGHPVDGDKVPDIRGMR